jgi:hypothetical protein
MRASQLLQKCLSSSLGAIHALRSRVLLRAKGTGVVKFVAEPRQKPQMAPLSRSTCAAQHVAALTLTITSCHVVHDSNFPAFPCTSHSAV